MYKITSNEKLNVLAGDTKKLKVKPADFSNIKKMEMPILDEVSIASDEAVKEVSEVPSVSTIEETPVIPNEIPAIESTVPYQYKETPSVQDISIVNPDSDDRINQKANYIKNSAEKVDPESKMDYDRTLVNGARQLLEIDETLALCEQKISEVKKKISDIKSLISVKKSDVVLIENDMKDKFPHPNFSVVLGRASWSNEEIQRVNDVYDKMTKYYAELIAILNDMKSNIAIDEQEITKNEKEQKTYESDRDAIKIRKKDTVKSIEESLKIASQSDKVREEAEEIARKAREEIQKRDAASKAMRLKNSFLYPEEQPEVVPYELNSSKVQKIEDLERLKQEYIDSRTYGDNNPFDAIRNSSRRAA